MKGGVIINGNVKAQRKRRKKMIRQVARLPDEYLLIDGNWSHYPVAYCKRKDAYITQGLINTHRCDKRKCEQLEKVVFYD